ncbi:MAG: DUF4397 domain-containing protein, partial [Saprospiraceae bacterium]|nr:DUF4397 domain-containing protein [Saprospiraceae bacterium]
FPATFAAGKTYIATASGIVGNGTTPFTLIVNDAGREAAADPTKVDIGFWHGSTNAPEVDVQLPGGPVLFDNFSYGEFSDYLEVAPGQYVLQVTPANDNGVVVQSYSANLSALAGEAITVFASGLLSGQPAFEVWVALADGTTFPLPVFVSANELTEKVTTLNIMPNPVSEVLQVRFRLSETETLRFRIRDAAGRLTQEGDWGLVPAGEFGETLNVGMLPTGIYQLEIVSDQGFVNRKFVVQD